MSVPFSSGGHQVQDGDHAERVPPRVPAPPPADLAAGRPRHADHGPGDPTDPHRPQRQLQQAQPRLVRCFR